MTATAQLLPLPRLVFYDSNGAPLTGGLVYTYVPGGTTPAETWQDAGEATPNSNPIVLDAGGSCLCYGSGDYQFTVTDSLGNSIPAYSGLSQSIVTSSGGTVTLSNIANIAALRANTTGTVTVFWLEGYYAPGDWGEGMFWLNSADTSSSDNSGTIIVDASGNRWYRETMGQSYSVKWFGAKGDGTTDDTAAIQLTVAAAALTSVKSVYVPPANYTISGTIGLTADGMEFRGIYLQSIITTTSASVDILDVDASFCYIHDLMLTSSVARTGGAHMNLASGQNSTKISNMYFENHYIGITVSAGYVSILDVEDCTFYGCVANVGIGIEIGSGLEIRLRNILMNSASSPQPTAGININACGDVTMHNVNVLQHARGLLINPASGQECDSVWATDSFFDHCGSYGVLIAPSGTGAVERCRFLQCWFGSAGISGFLVDATSGTLIGIDVEACDIFGNAGNGIEFDYGSDFKVNGCRIGGNTDSGVVFATNVSNWTVANNTIGPAGGFGGNGVNGMYISAGCDYFIIVGNRMHGNGTTNFNNNAASTANQIFTALNLVA